MVYERAFPYAKKHFKKIKVNMGKYDGSQKCQHISRQLLEEGNADTLVVTLSFVPRSGVNVHMINRVGRKFIDNTLGYLSKANTYYLMSEHDLEDLQSVNMSKMLTQTKEEVLKKLFTEKEIDGHGIKHEHI